MTASGITMNPEGSRFTLHAQEKPCLHSLPTPGEHMVRNALLAVAAGLEFGLSLEECVEGLASARLTGGRLTRKSIRGITVLDDTYNANPDSMEAALTTLGALRQTGGRRIAVLGRMGELGNHATAGYQRVGSRAASTIDALLPWVRKPRTLAETARASGLREIHETATTDEAAEVLRHTGPRQATSYWSKAAGPRGWNASSKTSNALLSLQPQPMGGDLGLRQ